MMIYNLSALPARTDVDQGGPGKCKMYLSRILEAPRLRLQSLFGQYPNRGRLNCTALVFYIWYLVYILYLPALVLSTETFHKSWDCVCRLVSGWAERHFISEIYMMNICNLFSFLLVSGWAESYFKFISITGWIYISYEWNPVFVNIWAHIW